MKLNGIEILPGQTKRIDVNLAKLPSNTSIDVPIIISRSKKPGPTLLLSGALHGDELNGTEIVRRIVDLGLNKPKCGTTICIPVINIFGFLHSSRYVPDGKDVNRSFPGSRSGSLASRVAFFVTNEILPMIDVGLDFHTGGADRTNYPQIRCMLKDPLNAQMAEAFGAPFLLDSKFRPNSFRQQAAKLGKNILVFEGGESSRFDEYAIQQGFEGTLRLMKHLKMYDSETAPIQSPSILIKGSSWVRARSSGFFQSTVACGSKVSKNEVVGYITDPFGTNKKTIKCGVNGYVVGLQNNPIVHQGDAIMHIGVVKLQP